MNYTDHRLCFLCNVYGNIKVSDVLVYGKDCHQLATKNGAKDVINMSTISAHQLFVDVLHITYQRHV